MASAIFNALAKGYTAKQLLDWILRNHPEHAGKINNALAAGYTAQQVLQYLTEGNSKGMSNSDRYYTDYEKTQQNYAKNLRNAQAGAVGTLGTAGALIGGLMALRNGQMPQAGQPAPTQPNPVTPQGGPPTPTQPIPETPPPQQQQGTQYTPQSASTILTSLNQLQRVENMAKAGNNPSVIADTIALTMQSTEKKAYKEAMKNGQVPHLQKVVEDYLQSNKVQPTATQNQPQAKEQAIQPTSQPPTPPPTPEPQTIEKQPLQEIPEAPEIQPEQMAPQPLELEKGVEVVTPSGIGTIKSLSDKKALIDVDGKTVQVEREKISQMPIPKKDLAELLEDLHRGIEEETGEDVSRMVQYAAYNPELNRLAFLPWQGDLYIYDDISPEDATKITSILAKRKTTGSNYIGAWTQGTKSPAGAELSALIQKIQQERGGKGKEYSAKLQTLYNPHEPAIQAKKRKYKEKQDKMKEQKKQRKKKKNDES